jgi:hypothetical protein
LLKRLERLGPAIDADGEAGAAPLQFDQRRSRRPVALHQPVGNVDHRFDAEAPEKQRQQCGRGSAVDVIVAEDGNGLASLDSIGHPRRRLVHVLEFRRVGQEIADGRRAVSGQVGFLHPAGEKQLIDQVAAELVAAVAAPSPRLSQQAALDPAGKGAHDSSSARKASASARVSAGTW